MVTSKKLLYCLKLWQEQRKGVPLILSSVLRLAASSQGGSAATWLWEMSRAVLYCTVLYCTAAPPPGCGRCPARASARQPATQTTQTRLSSVGSVKHQSWIFCPDGVRRESLAGEQLSLTDLLSSKMILISLVCCLFVCFIS